MSTPLTKELLDAELRAHKSETQEIAASLRSDVASLRSEFAEHRTASKADIADLRAEMHRGFSDMVKWIVGTAIVMGGTGITVMTFVLNNAAPKAPPAQQQTQPPTVIVVPAASPQAQPASK